MTIPTSTDRDRTQAQNLGFGYGIHVCLGAALARMESAIALIGANVPVRVRR